MRVTRKTTMAEDIHVIPVGSRWIVKPIGSDALSSHLERSDALRAGQARAQKDNAKLFVHAHDGNMTELNPFEDGLGINP